MASQGFIQPIAQDAQRTIPNNGNPNTVYNRAATAAPVQGWAANPITPAANFNGVDPNATIAKSNQNIATNGWVAPAPPANVVQGQGVLQLPAGWAEQIAKPTAPVNPTPAPTAPVQITVPDGLILGSNSKPARNDQLYASDPAYKQAWDEVAAFHKYDPNKAFTRGEDVAKLYDHIARLYKQYAGSAPAGGGSAPATGPTGTGSGSAAGAGSGTGAIAGGSGAVGGNTVGGGYTGIGLGSKTVDARTAQDISAGVAASQSGPRASSWNSDSGKSVGENLSSFIDSSLSSLGNNATAGSVMKVLDALSEPFLPGNMYMSELGQVNMPNVLSAIMNKAVPGLGTLGKWLATKIPADAGGLLGKLRDWVMNGKYQEAANQIYKDYDMEQAQNQAIYGGGGGDGRPSRGSIANGGGGGWLGGGSYGGGGGHGKTGSVTVGAGEKIPVATEAN